jgi:undecaprenyl-diphosphatase
MAEARRKNVFSRFDEAEIALCVLVNRSSRCVSVCRFFAFVSRLGNGVFWYALLASLPLVYGGAGITAAIHMGSVALIGVVIYKLLKGRLIRERPFISWPNIRCGAPPLDRYSFPSGHSLHAAAFSILVMFHFPELGWVVLPFAGLVAMSRVVLGLHYPSDVFAGGAIGALLAGTSIYIVGL